jgi:hypothetical protein
MARLITVLGLCGLVAFVASVSPGCDGAADGDADGDSDGDGDGDCDPEGTVCGNDYDCCNGLSCKCEVPPCADEDFTCATCQPLGEGCNTSLECCRDGVCVGHACVPVFDRDYEVTVVSATIYERDTIFGDGNYWDPQPCDLVPDSCTPADLTERLPDPYAEVKIGDTDYTTQTFQNNAAPIWEESFTVHMTQGIHYSAYIYEEDGAEDAVVAQWGYEIEPYMNWSIEARTLRMGMMQLNFDTHTAQYTQLRLQFVPQE